MAKGKSLDGDRKAAIEKYNDVVVGLEVARDLVAQIKALSLEEAKKAKKASKKEQQEKYKAEIARVASTLEIQVKSRLLKKLISIWTLVNSFLLSYIQLSFLLQ